MIKKIIFFLILINSKFLFAQSNNEYLFDLSAINPAAIVVESSSISLFHSKKLSGIKDAPLTQNIRWKNSFGESNAIALNVQSVKKGVSGIMSYEFSYAFTAKVFAKNKLTLGLSSSLNTVYIDESLLVSGSDNDNLLSGSYYSETLPNSTAGIYFYNDKLKLGISTRNMFRNNIFSRSYDATNAIEYLSFIDYKVAFKQFQLNIGNATFMDNNNFNSKVHIIGEYKNIILGSTYDALSSAGVMTGMRFKHMTFQYYYSTPQNVNNTLKLGGSEIKITYLINFL